MVPSSMLSLDPMENFTYPPHTLHYLPLPSTIAAAPRLGATLAGIPFVDPAKHAVEGVPRTTVVGLLVSRKFRLAANYLRGVRHTGML
jgi:hypothetical protein